MSQRTKTNSEIDESACVAVGALSDEERKRLIMLMLPASMAQEHTFARTNGTPCKGRTCVVCGNKFDARSSIQVYCSSKCREVSKKSINSRMLSKNKESAERAVAALPDETRTRLGAMLKGISLW